MESIERVCEPMQSTDIGKLAEALSKAQSEMEGAKKDAKNPFFKSDYSTLFAVWQACRGPLTKNGLSVIQTTGGNGSGVITVYTILAHSSGQWIKGALSIKPAKTDPQTLGSCLTYLRRYALAGVVGLSPLDDDAEAAMKEPRMAPDTGKKTTAKTANKTKTEKEHGWKTQIRTEFLPLAKKLGIEKYNSIIAPHKSALDIPTKEEAQKIHGKLVDALDDTEGR